MNTRLAVDQRSIILEQVRATMRENQLDWLLVPTSDSHNSEYPPKADNRREFLTGFTGSAGTAIVTKENAFLATDSRYFVQAEKELNSEWTLVKNPSLVTFFTENVPKFLPQRIGYNSLLFSEPTISQLSKTIKTMKYPDNKTPDTTPLMVGLESDIIDPIWQRYNRPPYPNSELFEYDTKYTGETRCDRIHRFLRMCLTAANDDVREKTGQKDLVLVTDLTDIAYLLNLRGNDVDFVPVFRSYFLLTCNFPSSIDSDSSHDMKEWCTPYLFTDCIVPEILKEQLQTEINLQLRPYSSFFDSLRSEISSDSVVFYSHDEVSVGISQIILSHSSPRVDISPVVNSMKAVKNSTEIEQMKAIHLLDSVSLIRFHYHISHLPTDQTHTEVSLSHDLHRIRMEGSPDRYQGPSFSPIIAVDENAAIVHYHPGANKNPKQVTGQSMLLMDTGGHYLGGTTDVTRTVHLGKPSEKQKQIYTQVLRSHLALMLMKFELLSTGKTPLASSLSAISLNELWKLGYAQPHGIGHGVSNYLSVHEYPSFSTPQSLPLDCFITDEPGIYVKDEFGVRIESLLHVCEIEGYGVDPSKKFGHFQTMTYVPYDRKLISKEQLDPDMIKWIDFFHQQCFDLSQEHLTDAERDWLREETKPL
ncbi:putative Xaa-Pro aminopeptidase 1 [Blattamonas nauphoetae]|uniref:Xaa-Pro aminopeptidase 1 n=1 Tax=Blattamonas nauphoetae TaxID=2049346 RepID=A0ABQ9Y1Q5_9EUKA|nr:putative Xaa-Pro aminopeptidase 1 [Blattamonas nauphoetae]